MSQAAQDQQPTYSGYLERSVPVTRKLLEVGRTKEMGKTSVSVWDVSVQGARVYHTM
jgi:hypothetical protein